MPVEAWAAGAAPTLHVVVNGGAGASGRDETVAAIEPVFRAAGRAFRLWEAATPGQLGDVARQAVAAARADGGIVVASGGDGTINTVAHAVLGSGVDLGVLPQGTFNYFARVHELPLDAAEAARALLDGEARPIQVGVVGERIFLVNASVGIYPTLLEDREARKQQFGRHRWVALLAAAQTFLREHRQLRLRLEADGQPARTVKTPTVFVGNNRLQLEQVGIADAAAVDRGGFVVVMLRPVGTLAMIGLLARGAFGRLGDAGEVDHFATRRLGLALVRKHARRIKVATDGEVAWLQAPLEFSVSPMPLRLVVPRARSGAAAPAGSEP